jgi:pimeloyl-ACP methyl ester carboxylesterase
VLEAVNQRLEARAAAGLPARNVTLVAHSLGGAVALRMFCDAECSEQHAELLSKVDGLILLSPMDVSVNKPDPMFRKIAEISGAEVAIGDALGLLEAKVAEATMASTARPESALRQEADARLLYLRDDARRRAAQAMLLQAVPWKAERPDWESIEPVEGNYCKVDLPALILWGRRDETLPVSMGYKLAAELPKARLMCLPGVMHSPHIETPAECARLIRAFVENPGGEGAVLDSAHGTRSAGAGNP